MRHLAGVGVEYDTEWVIEHLFQARLTPVDGEELFEELLDECYPEVKIGCCTFSPSQVMKELDAKSGKWVNFELRLFPAEAARLMSVLQAAYDACVLK